MTALRPGYLAIVLMVGLAGSAQAQFVAGRAPGGGYATYPGPGATPGYYSINPGFGNYGLPGTFPGYRGYGLSGYGPGADLGGYFNQTRANLTPRTSNDMGGLINSIRTQTGRGNSYGSGVNGGVSPRRGRRN